MEDVDENKFVKSNEVDEVKSLDVAIKSEQKSDVSVRKHYRRVFHRLTGLDW